MYLENVKLLGMHCFIGSLSTQSVHTSQLVTSPHALRPSSPSSPGYYAPPLSTPLIPRRRHERSTPPPLPSSSMPSVFLDIKGGMPTLTIYQSTVATCSVCCSHLISQQVFTVTTTANARTATTTETTTTTTGVVVSTGHAETRVAERN